MSTQDAAAQRKIVNRLKRARGQLDALITAVEDGRSCRDVVMQLSAVASALDKAGYAVVANAMQECLVDPDHTTEDGLTPAELEKLFLTLA
ncbi:metal-sensitive transcriptional regulator [Isoptericola sp. b515]|uniref:metal-sensitive transcriptional regulator n=1 Tax=Isoptericola sp. b515 TaxID=3064652 RepID=UPI002712C0A3|nr:metal-sensitive transcriptional regulator [Isoptericola sp. b515]MDO8147811.1 metal-sensitive transcriptional regulator [Isoptericola sp. b515]